MAEDRNWTDDELAAAVDAFVRVRGHDGSPVAKADSLAQLPMPGRSAHSVHFRMNHIAMTLRKVREGVGFPAIVAANGNVGPGVVAKIIELLHQRLPGIPAPAGDSLDGRWFFINTDATSFGGVSPHDRWLAHGMAFAGGPPGFGERLGRTVPGDVLFAWASGIGIVAIGVVREPWDRVHHEEALVYREPYRAVEYRLQVNWLVDLRDAPISREALGVNPVQSLEEIGTGRRARLAGLLGDLQPLRVADEVPEDVVYVEGATRRVAVNVHERNPLARAACVRHFGATCVVCDFDFAATYGDLARNPAGEPFIHVHHLRPLHEIGSSYVVNPVRDLVPICPNCHAMVHRTAPPVPPAELRARLGRPPRPPA